MHGFDFPEGIQEKQCKEEVAQCEQKLLEATKHTAAQQQALKEAKKAVAAEEMLLEDSIRALKLAEKARCSSEASHKVLMLLSTNVLLPDGDILNCRVHFLGDR